MRGKSITILQLSITYHAINIHLNPQQLRKQIPISRSSNLHWQNSIELTARFVLMANFSLADVLFSQTTPKTDCWKPKNRILSRSGNAFLCVRVSTYLT
jgi:hypothetical protein